MKIVFVTDSYWPRINGLTVSVDVFSAALIEMGHDVHIITNQYTPNDYQFDQRLPQRRMHRFPAGPATMFSKEDFQIKPYTYGRVVHTLSQLKPDIIHIHTAEFSLGQIARLFARYKRIPLVMSSHTHWEHYIHEYVPFLPLKTAQWTARMIMRLSYRKASMIIAPSVLHRELMISYHLKRKIIRVIPTGFNLKEFELDPMENQRVHQEFHTLHPILKTARKLLFVGRIGKEKNIDLLLDVMESVIKKFPDTVLVMIGDGPYRKNYTHQVHMRGMQNHFIFTGYIDHWKIKYFYSDADIFVFPSVSETQGMVTVEAMACRTPVVAVGEMGTFYVMGGDNGGYLVENNAQVFAEKVISLLDDNDLRQNKSIEAYNFAQGWSINKMAHKLFELYSGLVSNK